MSDAYFLVLDLEATCDKTGFPRDERETIEIGALLVGAASLTVIHEYQTFVRPIRHPQLTDYCIDLTSISQETVDAAPGFPSAFQGLLDLIEPFGSPTLASWGRYDHRQLNRDCAFHALDYPFAEHMDLSALFMRRVGLKRRISMANAMKRCGLTMSGTQHRGIDDAKNLLRLMPWCLERQPMPAATTT
ncbi:MAG: 3'-5' exonuclease [Myxococcota bacterium]|nr:3'-5' exonuclease [Myxococcota bacterium]